MIGEGIEIYLCAGAVCITLSFHTVARIGPYNLAMMRLEIGAEIHTGPTSHTEIFTEHIFHQFSGSICHEIT
jgi:hypothetical protein